MTKQQRKKLDILWQQRITGGQCSHPGCSKEGTEGHHIFKRRYHNTRWDIDNGRALCRTHHDWAERHPIAYEVLIVEQIGHDAYGALREKALMVKKQFYDGILKELKCG
ncbi:HNH endonuclease [Candidatus Pacearchaeota archaeon]|nr:HNH endonuclease [Candidatus Pacearchaeota archaeon]